MSAEKEILQLAELGEYLMGKIMEVQDHPNKKLAKSETFPT